MPPQRPAKKRWRVAALQELSSKRSLYLCRFRLPGLAAFAFLLVAWLIGCAVDQSALQRDPFMRDMMSLQQQGDQPHKMGQTFDVGNTRWKVNAAHAALALRLGSSTLLKARGKFVVIDFTFTNLTNQAQRPTANMLQLQDAQLKTYTSDAHITAMLSSWQKTPDFLKDVFQPSRAYDCSIVFDLPVETAGLTLNFQSFPTEDSMPPI
jgi:hypothetical protein